ncbi:histidine phosphatase family protein [Hydrogenophaga sp. 5NK40-0174]|uniref:histidine phosphatase family protein n=1 Tax=Hydrogenophaga sp. 5NK40-0174 TaxID=3127649 RepID=UPI003105587E
MRITLIRHGKPTFELKGNMRAGDLGQIARSYDASGISDTPGLDALEAVKGHERVVCSALLRSQESASALGFSEVHLSDAMFNEVAVPHFNGGSLRLPVRVWVVVLRVMWLMGFAQNGESVSAAKRRAKLAASELVGLAQSHGSVLLVGHGFINLLIAKELQRVGWDGPPRPISEYWGTGVYERPVAPLESVNKGN